MLAKNIIYNPIPGTPISISIYSTKQEYPHYHDGVLEVIYCFKGTATLRYGYEFIEINAGDILSCNSRTIHALSSDEDNLLVSFYIDLKHPCFGKEKLDKIWFVCEKYVLTQEKQNEMQNLKHLLLALLYFFCFPNEKVPSGKMFTALTQDIIKMFLTHFHFFDYMNMLPYYTPEAKERYERIHIYIIEHFNEKITSEKICLEEHLTPHYLSHFFKTVSYWNLPKTLNFVRIRHSDFLLLTTEMNISDISYEVGFSDPKFFYKNFKAIYNTTPLQHKKTYLKLSTSATDNVYFMPDDIRFDLEHYISYYFATLHIPDFWNVPFTYLRNVPEV